MSADRKTELPHEESIFSLFVYGTLKCGFSNHDAFCEGTLKIEEAFVRGDLYDLPFGFPALVVPEGAIRAAGTSDHIQDVVTQRRLNGSLVALPQEGSPQAFGELLTFDDPGDRLAKLDRLEGFDPAGQSLYRRVLIPVETPTRRILAWAYTIEKPTGAHLSGGHWPS